MIVIHNIYNLYHRNKSDIYQEHVQLRIALPKQAQP